MDTNVKTAGLAPFSLKDAPAMIERVFPAQKVGIESQKERKAGAGQTLTALGSYWKGRKPLVLVRATLIASLLPATDDPIGDLRVFEALMRMDLDGMSRRNPEVTADHVMMAANVPWATKGEYVLPVGGAPGREASFKWKPLPARRSGTGAQDVRDAREELKKSVFAGMRFSDQVFISDRVENVELVGSPDDPLYEGIWASVNKHLGTVANTLTELVEQLGIARFGQRPTVGDPFCGGGSIPFEAGRIGCNVVASDLNPVAAMLTWGAFNVIGATPGDRSRLSVEQAAVAADVDRRVTALGVETDASGNRAKTFLYCLEVVDPQTGWLVPMLTNFVVSAKRRVIIRATPDYSRKKFDLAVVDEASKEDFEQAQTGTVQGSYLVYRVAQHAGGEEETWRISVAKLRGDDEGPERSNGERGNRLRRWEISDIAPRAVTWDPGAKPPNPAFGPGAWVGGDIFQERLYCVQWMSGTDIAEGKGRPATWFSTVTDPDLAREEAVKTYVSANLATWQDIGIVPDMKIEPGAKTDEPIRTRGWTHWHHLFSPRNLLVLAAMRLAQPSAPFWWLETANQINWNCKQCLWFRGFDTVNHALDSMAFDQNVDWGVRSSYVFSYLRKDRSRTFRQNSDVSIYSSPARDVTRSASIWVFDPPYADAIDYHEITEFFIAWLRKGPPPPFNDLLWDSRRPFAIQGKGEKFRADMVAAFSAMASHMPDNGLQVCMFTHKDAGVWADMAGIVWAGGLRVTAAWYVSTETTSAQKTGGHVQGTVLLVLRKRSLDEQGFRSDIVPEVRAKVAQQVATLTGLNQQATGHGRDENLFSDADIQMAGYAAALEILTGYTHIDGVDMTREALRPRSVSSREKSAAPGIVEEMIALAVQTANELMLPDGLAEGLWERLGASERFYLKMAAAEAGWPAGATGGKLDDYQNFAKAYRAEGWEDLMADRQPNRARLKSATEFRSAYLNGHAISSGSLRPTLYAVMCLKRDAEAEVVSEDSSKQVMHGLRDHFGDAEWLRERDNVRILASWLGRTWGRRNPAEATAARVLASLVQSERL